MNKLGAIAIVVGTTIIVYLLLIVIMPFIAGIASTANTTMAASSNLSNYPGAAEVMLASPLWLMFVPGGLCIVVVIGILRYKG